MNKLIMAFTLLLTPFFSQFSMANEPDSVSPDIESKNIITGVTSPDFSSFVGSPLDSFTVEGYDSESDNWRTPSEISEPINDHSTKYGFSYDVWDSYGGWHSTGNLYEGFIVTVSYQPEDSKTCAPVAHPAYIYGVDNDGDGNPDECFKENPNLEQCPQGNYKYKLAGGCVPIDCGGAGQQKTMWSSGSVYNNTTGTYCDGSCAHSVSGGQNVNNYSGNIGITGVSTGEICGQGGLEDRWHNEGVGDTCVSENGFISCPNGDTPDAPTENTPTVDLEPEKLTLEEITPLIPVEETCATGDASCEIRNLKETLITKGLEQKEIDKLLHNKKITADEKTSTKIIDGLNESTGRNLQGLEMVTAAINGLKGEIGTGGGASNGNGFGDGDVTCDGDDCEGGILTDIEPSEGLEGYWESEYEDGLEGMFLEKLEDYKSTEFYLFLDQFNPQISGGSAPDYNWCFNFGQYMNLGCHNLTIDSRVFPALKIFLLISAAFACRVILFGG